MHTTESTQNYLETILILSLRQQHVRSVDVARELDFSKPSVSVAMKGLREKKLISVSEDGYLHLTKEGEEIASMIYERHQVLSQWFIDLGVDEKIAVEDACKIEHDLSPESFAAIKAFIQQNSKKKD